jgi:pimeloyl-ACP methyl ester carboxylesterase
VLPAVRRRRGPWIADQKRMTLRGESSSEPAAGSSAVNPLPETRGPVESASVTENVAYERVVLRSARGPVETRFYCRPELDCGAICVGGVGGGFDTPARGLYPALCVSMMPSRVCGLRVEYRDPHDLSESVSDVLTALRFLHDQGVHDTALVGHSFGGAVVARAAASSNRHSSFVRAVVLLATQAHGVEALADLAPRCGALIIHGTADTVLPPSCSEYAYELAHEPKKLILYPGAGHSLDEVASEVRKEVREWILSRIRPAWGWS